MLPPSLNHSSADITCIKETTCFKSPQSCDSCRSFGFDWIALMAPPGRALSVNVPGMGVK
ncbi:unnamed protein product [Arabidopsis thaliana]|uniref:(thale cress) hypothetical protein n=1 Tax=Arabidopsis thaliana TaxID=3702 RepID=A0A7G2FC19_ARATH|nr:unnamed protein product [Arabidopsis thaliana]